MRCSSVCARASAARAASSAAVAVSAAACASASGASGLNHLDVRRPGAVLEHFTCADTRSTRLTAKPMPPSPTPTTAMSAPMAVRICWNCVRLVMRLAIIGATTGTASTRMAKKIDAPSRGRRSSVPVCSQGDPRAQIVDAGHRAVERVSHVLRGRVALEFGEVAFHTFTAAARNEAFSCAAFLLLTERRLRGDDGPLCCGVDAVGRVLLPLAAFGLLQLRFELLF